MQNGIRQGEEPHVNSSQVLLPSYRNPFHSQSFLDLGIIGKGLSTCKKMKIFNIKKRHLKEIC